MQRGSRAGRKGSRRRPAAETPPAAAVPALARSCPTREERPRPRHHLQGCRRAATDRPCRSRWGGVGTDPVSRRSRRSNSSRPVAVLRGPSKTRRPSHRPLPARGRACRTRPDRRGTVLLPPRPTPPPTRTVGRGGRNHPTSPATGVRGARTNSGGSWTRRRTAPTLRPSRPRPPGRAPAVPAHAAAHRPTLSSPSAPLRPPAPPPSPRNFLNSGGWATTAVVGHGALVPPPCPACRVRRRRRRRRRAAADRPAAAASAGAEHTRAAERRRLPTAKGGRSSFDWQGVAGGGYNAWPHRGPPCGHLHSQQC